MRRITSEAAVPRLRELLDASGYDEQRPTLTAVWAGVRAWVTLPVTDVEGRDADLVLFETVLSKKPATEYEPGPHFRLVFTRQFRHEEDRGGGMEQVLVQLDYPVLPAFEDVVKISGLRGYGAELWAQGGADCSEWIRRVEDEPGFRAASEHAPLSVRISQGRL